MPYKSKQKLTKIFPAFTLVELIVVIVILSILATIAFLSFNSYSSSTRDSVRVSDISSIAKWLTLQYSIWWKYNIPESSILLLSWSVIIWYQWKAWFNILSTIKLSNNWWKDPLDNTYYTYNTNLSQNKYQLSWFLESKWSIINRVGYESFINQTNATNYTKRYPYIKGDNIWVILNYTWTTSNPVYSPLEDINSLTWIDVSSWSQTIWKINISNNSDSATWVNVISLSGYINTIISNTILVDGLSSSNPWVNCLTIKTNYPSSVDWIYWIKPDSNPTFQVYCDMINDWWGWTLVMRGKWWDTTWWQTIWALNIWNSTSTVWNSFKFSDANINLIATNKTYRLIGDGTFTVKRFAWGWTYNHLQNAIANNLAYTYSDIWLTTNIEWTNAHRWTDHYWISDHWDSSRETYFLTNRAVTLVWYVWTHVWWVYCVWSTAGCNFNMWVR